MRVASPWPTKRRHQIDSGLPRSPQHPAHRPVYGQQSSAIPEALAVIALLFRCHKSGGKILVFFLQPSRIFSPLPALVSNRWFSSEGLTGHVKFLFFTQRRISSAVCSSSHGARRISVTRPFRSILGARHRSGSASEPYGACLSGCRLARPGVDADCKVGGSLKARPHFAPSVGIMGRWAIICAARSQAPAPWRWR